MSSKRTRVGLLILLAVSLLLIYWSYWVGTLRKANEDFAAGRLEQALAGYERAQHQFPNLLAHRLGFLAPVRETLLKQAQIHYRQEEFEKGLELLQGLSESYPFLAGDAQYHRWHGNLLFRHTILQEETNMLLDGMQAALREYQRALELDASSWDSRFNYELVKRILSSELEEGPQQLELLIDEVLKSLRRREDDIPPERIG